MKQIVCIVNRLTDSSIFTRVNQTKNKSYYLYLRTKLIYLPRGSGHDLFTNTITLRRLGPSSVHEGRGLVVGDLLGSYVTSFLHDTLNPRIWFGGDESQSNYRLSLYVLTFRSWSVDLLDRYVKSV